MDAAHGTEVVLGDALVELIERQLLQRRVQMEIRFIDTPDEDAFLRTDGAVAHQRIGWIKLGLESNLAAMTAPLVSSFHLVSHLEVATRADVGIVHDDTVELLNVSG